jgi:hypothetical protein
LGLELDEQAMLRQMRCNKQMLLDFLQLIWQVGGLTYLWYIGSPQSKEEEEERNQEMLQWIIKD